MHALMKIGLVGGGLLAAYAVLGKEPRFLGDKAEVGDEISVPVALLPPGTLGSGTFGALPNQQFGHILGIVVDAGKDVLSVAPKGIFIEQRLEFPNQATLNAQKILISVPRDVVKGITRGGRPVVL